MSTLEKFAAFVRWLGRSDHSGTRAGRDKGNLFGDKSGAIIVAGVWMASLLAAGVFYIIGTGDAIIYRERLQDAADAAAYTSAGVHARGMNLIVMINLVMAALLAVLIVFRMVIMMLGIAIVACGICIAATIFCPLSGICASLMQPMVKLETQMIKGANKYADILNYVLPALSGLEKVIAIATPWVGAYKGSKVGGYYNPIETSAFVVSPSLIPVLPDGKKLGLPVEEMDYKKFCGKSAELAIGKGFSWIGGAGQLLGAFAGWVVKAFSGYFCGNDQGSAEEIMKKKFDDMINDGCDKQGDACKDASSKAKQNNDYNVTKCTGNVEADKATPNCVSKYCDIGLGLTEFNKANCVTDGKKTAKDKQDQTGFNGGGGGINAGQGGMFKLNKTPKDIWAGAQIGGFWFQVFAITKGDAQWPRKMDRGLAIATKTGQMPNVQAQWGGWRIADAEFYFDDKGKWKDLKEDCMWKMGWRARLRRFDLAGLNLAGLGAETVMTKMFDKLSEKLGDWLNTKTGGSVLTSGAIQGVFDKLGDELKKVVGDSSVIQGANGAIDSFIMPSWEFVH